MITTGSRVVIPAGTKVTVNGATTKRTHESFVTVRGVTYTRAGNAKVTWKSNGYKATAILKS